MWFCTSGGAWSTPSLCLLIFCLRRRVSSVTQTPLFWGRPRGSHPLYCWGGGDAFTFGHSPACGIGGGTRPAPGACPHTWHSPWSTSWKPGKSLTSSSVYIWVFLAWFSKEMRLCDHTVCEFTPLPHQDRFKLAYWFSTTFDNAEEVSKVTRLPEVV